MKVQSAAIALTILVSQLDFKKSYFVKLNFLLRCYIESSLGHELKKLETEESERERERIEKTKNLYRCHN